MPNVFITAAGTGVGKTLITCALAHQLRTQGKKVTALKPVITGYDANDKQSDTALILQACNLPPAHAEKISPWRYAPPLAPSMATQNPPSLDALTDFCRSQRNDIVLVEGVGGIMTPINNRHTMLDWMGALNWPVVLVAGTYLGALSHTLCALEVLKNRPLKVQALVVSESENSPVPLEETVATLEKHMDFSIPVVKIPRLAPAARAWEHVPALNIV